MGPIEQQLRRQVTEAFVEPKPTETPQTNGCIPGDVTNDYKHYSSYAPPPPPAPPSSNKGPRVRARSAPGIGVTGCTFTFSTGIQLKLQWNLTWSAVVQW